MATSISTSIDRNRILGFVWQHVLLFLSLFVMTLGVALSVRSALGSSVISTIPYVLTLAGDSGFIYQMTIGEWTYIMNFVFVVFQILVLRRRFQPVQLFQLIIGFVFGWLLDVNMSLTESLQFGNLGWRIMEQLMGCTLLGVGIAFEIKCGSVTMPGEGFPVALSKITGAAFPKAKIAVDVSLTLIAVALGFFYFHTWVWEVVGPGTLFAMIYVGAAVKAISPRIGWFDRLLCFHPGFRRYLYGLKAWIVKSKR